MSNETAEISQAHWNQKKGKKNFCDTCEFTYGFTGIFYASNVSMWTLTQSFTNLLMSESDQLSLMDFSIVSLSYRKRSVVTAQSFSYCQWTCCLKLSTTQKKKSGSLLSGQGRTSTPILVVPFDSMPFSLFQIKTAWLLQKTARQLHHLDPFQVQILCCFSIMILVKMMQIPC